MGFNYKIINPLTDISWKHTCKNSAFFTSNWAEVITSTYGYKPLYFLLSDDEKILSFVPVMEIDNLLTGKKGISLPFSDVCEPYASTFENFNNLFAFIIEYGRKNGWRSIEIRGGKEFLGDHKILSMYYEHLLDLTPHVDDIFSGFKDTVRRNIRKAGENDVHISFDQSIKAMAEFIRLNKITRKRHGLPSQPRKFFLNLYDKVIVKKMGHIISAEYEGKTVSSNIYLMTGDQVIYKYGASDYRYQSLRCNNLLMWESIRYFKDAGYKMFSFGRTFPENSGLMKFKSGWSDNIRIVYYYKYNLKSDLYETDKNPEKSYINVFFKNIPVFVSSILGTVFYKYFA